MHCYETLDSRTCEDPSRGRCVFLLGGQDIDVLLAKAGLRPLQQDSKLGGLIRLIVAQRVA